MEILLPLLVIMFIGLVFTYPAGDIDWEINLNDKYSYYLKQFKEENKT